MSPVHGECAPRFRGVRERFEKSFEQGELGGALCVVLDGDPVIDLWGGFADGANQRPWQRDTIVHTASTTKGMTATCLHRLVDAGRIDLDAPVVRYWPEFGQAGKAEVPVHLLPSHRVGLPAIRRDLPREARYDWETMTAALAAEEPWWEPATKHGYHAETFGWLVGELVRRVDGRSLGTYFREEIAGPLGLDFHIGVRPQDESRCAEMVPTKREPRAGSEPRTRNKIYAAMSDKSTLLGRVFSNPPMGRDEFNTPEWRRSEIPAANGHGTAAAVARLYAALARGGELDGVHVLSAEAIERATTEQAFGPDAVLLGMPMRFGLGYMLTQRSIPLGPNPRAFGHLGMGGSMGFADPDTRLGFGYVMNRMQSGVTGDARGFALIQAVYSCL